MHKCIVRQRKIIYIFIPVNASGSFEINCMGIKRKHAENNRKTFKNNFVCYKMEICLRKVYKHKKEIHTLSFVVGNFIGFETHRR